MHPKTNGVPSVAMRSLVATVAAVSCPTSISLAKVEVDTELLFLVEVSKGIDASTFSSVMGAYGAAMTNESVIAEIQRGSIGKIAAAMVFWSDRDQQVVGVNWMEIFDSDSALGFSNQLNSLSLPFAKPQKTAIAAAINFSTPLFGTETGGAENGFRSLTQIIDVAGFNTDDGSRDKGLRGDTLIPIATKSALSSGVDLINGMAIGDKSGAVESYYKSYVIGGSYEGTLATVRSEADLSVLENSLVQMLARNAAIGAAASVPEPSHGALFAACGLLIFYRRR